MAQADSSSISGGHTPGPWDCVPSTEHHGPYVVSQFGCDIADCYTMTKPGLASTLNGGESRPVPFMGEMADANARLIAAAPELLEALEEAVNELAEFVGDYREHSACAVIERARAAIARARGEQA